jgi:MobL relaxases
MKVITVMKKGVGGTGISQATRYVSRRERDESREGWEPRKLFSESEDKLGWHRANRVLGDGGDPKTDDILHLVISFENEDDFNQLGSNEETRQEAVRETTRNTMKNVADELNAGNLRWVAGIHRNTDNPHVHLLIHRDYTDRETQRIQRLKTLPKEMRVSWERTENGQRIVNPGELSRTFEAFLEQSIARAKQVDQQRYRYETANAKNDREERLILGQAIIAEEKIERLTKMRDDAIKYGKHYRYEFTNGQGRGRGFSEHDIHQRAWARAFQEMVESESNLTPEARRQMREAVIADELRRHEELVRKHRVARNTDLMNIELRLERAIEASHHLIGKASSIRSRYEAAERPAPIPILSREKLASLQDRAIERGDRERIQRLEEIRTVLASEHGSPTRTDSEVGQLRAQLFIAQTSLIVEQESSVRFEEIKHLLRFRLAGEGGIKRSLAEIERTLAYEKDQAKFIGSRDLHWDDTKRSEAQVRVENLSRQHELLLDRIEEARAEIIDQAAHKAEIVTTLYGIFFKEEERYRSEGRELPEPLFSVYDLKELESAASRLHHPTVYRTLAELERNFDARTDQREQVSVTGRTSRARARAILGEISLRESELNLDRFNERRELIDVIANDDGRREMTIARLADFERRSPLEHLFHPSKTHNNRHRDVAAAVNAYGERLIEQQEKASASYTILIDEARAYEEEFSRLHPEGSLPHPRFTPWEISKLELHAAKEPDPSLRARYEMLYFEALKNERDDVSRRIVIEKDADQLLDPISLGEHPVRSDEARLIYHFVNRTDQNREVSFER